jgi:hypothetical protein
MNKLITVVFITLFALLGALLIMMRPRKNDTPQVQSVHEIQLPAPQAPAQARRMPQQAPAPILPSWGRRAGTSAGDESDPTWRNLPPWLKGGAPDMSPEGIAKGKKLAHDAYERFVERAQLTREQRERFDATIRDYNKAFDEIALRVTKDHELFTADMQDQWNRDAYARIKATLTTEQYDVFMHEIGLGFGFVAAFKRDH